MLARNLANKHFRYVHFNKPLKKMVRIKFGGVLVQVSRLYMAGVLLFAGVGCSLGMAQSNIVKVRGAASMVLVGQKVATFYHFDNPDLAVDVNVATSVQAIPAGNATVWQTVGANNAAQKKNLQDRFGAAPQQLPIGIEGVLVIMNRENPVTDLSLEQLRAIYMGKISNWKEVGGRDLRIHLYSTESAIGGSMFFQDFVLHGEDFDTTMRGYTNPKKTAEAVAADAAAIGLTPVAGEAAVKYPRLRGTATSPGVEGSSENLRSRAYPLSTYLYWSFAKNYSPAIEHFVEFVLSERGQMAIEASGCYPLNPNERTMGAVALAQLR